MAIHLAAAHPHQVCLHVQTFRMRPQAVSEHCSLTTGDGGGGNDSRRLLTWHGGVQFKAVMVENTFTSIEEVAPRLFPFLRLFVGPHRCARPCVRPPCVFVFESWLPCLQGCYHSIKPARSHR